MLGIISSKRKNKYIYVGHWLNDKRTEEGYFRLAIEKDDDLMEEDLHNLDGKFGNMRISTKSNLPFEPNDLVTIRGQKYSIEKVDGDRKLDGELAMVYFKDNGNITKYIDLRRLG